MKFYLDMCALKRPFDDQSNDRISLETQAVIQILKWSHFGSCKMVHSEALDFENRQNPKIIRRNRVSVLMKAFGRVVPGNPSIAQRALHLRAFGFADMDAWHIAFAENQQVDYFITCDDRILKIGHRVGVKIRVKFINPIDLVRDHHP